MDDRSRSRRLKSKINFVPNTTDGAKGIQAIKRAGGITFAQDANSVLFSGMPNTAIQTGFLDFILVPGIAIAQLCRLDDRDDPELERDAGELLNAFTVAGSHGPEHARRSGLLRQSGVER